MCIIIAKAHNAIFNIYSINVRLKLFKGGLNYFGFRKSLLRRLYFIINCFKSLLGTLSASVMEGLKAVEKGRSWQLMVQTVSHFGGCPQILHSHLAQLQTRHLNNALEVCYKKKAMFNSSPQNTQTVCRCNFFTDFRRFVVFTF